MRLYLAGPMTGLPDNNYPEFFLKAKALEEVGYQVSNPATIDDVHEKEVKGECVYCRTERDHPWEWYVLRGLAMLSACDAIALLPAWNRSAGTRVEVEFAKGMQIPIGSAFLFLDRYVSIQNGGAWK